MKRRVHSSSNVSSGFTLIEILIAIAVLAVVVAVVMPSFNVDDRQRLNAAAMILTSDIEFAQVMSIANPQDPLVVRFDNDGVRYWVAHASSPNDPIDRPDTGDPYLVELGEGRAATATGVGFTLFDVADRAIEFESHGGLADFTSTPIIALTVQGSSYPRVLVRVAPTTGTLTVAYEPKAP